MERAAINAFAEGAEGVIHPVQPPIDMVERVRRFPVATLRSTTGGALYVVVLWTSGAKRRAAVVEQLTALGVLPKEPI